MIMWLRLWLLLLLLIMMIGCGRIHEKFHLQHFFGDIIGPSQFGLIQIRGPQGLTTFQDGVQVDTKLATGLPLLLLIGSRRLLFLISMMIVLVVMWKDIKLGKETRWHIHGRLTYFSMHMKGQMRG